MLLASAVVVWEWLNEHGRWRPYSPAVCHHIEAVIRSDPRCGSVVLGQVDLRLSPYIIDLHSMHQFRQDTGEQRSGEERWNNVAGPFFYLFPHGNSRLYATSAAKVDALGGTFDVKCSRNVRDFKKRFRKADRCMRPSHHLSDPIFILRFFAGRD